MVLRQEVKDTAPVARSCFDVFRFYCANYCVQPATSSAQLAPACSLACCYTISICFDESRVSLISIRQQNNISNHVGIFCETPDDWAGRWQEEGTSGGKIAFAKAEGTNGSRSRDQAVRTSVRKYSSETVAAASKDAQAYRPRERARRFGCSASIAFARLVSGPFRGGGIEGGASRNLRQQESMQTMGGSRAVVDHYTMHSRTSCRSSRCGECQARLNSQPSACYLVLGGMKGWG